MTATEHKGIGVEGRYQWHWMLSTSNGLPSAGKSWGNPRSFINAYIKAKARKSFPKWEMSNLCHGSQTNPFLVWHQMTDDAAAPLLDACTKQQRGTVATHAIHNPYPNWLRELLSFLCVINHITWGSHFKNSPFMVMHEFSCFRRPSVSFNLKKKKGYCCFICSVRKRCGIWMWLLRFGIPEISGILSNTWIRGKEPTGPLLNTF